jgi:hypothetical protein
MFQLYLRMQRAKLLIKVDVGFVLQLDRCGNAAPPRA